MSLTKFIAPKEDWKRNLQTETERASFKAKLTPKKNLLRTIKFAEPEYVPFGMESTYWIHHRDDLFYSGNGDDTATKWTDGWGVQFERRDLRIEGYPVFHPLKNFENLESYNWPDFRSPEIMEEASRVAAKIDRKEYFIMGVNFGFMFVRSWLLVGMEDLFMGMLTCPDKVAYFMDKIVEYQIGIAKRYIKEVGIDIAFIGDDVAGTKALLIRPSLWRYFVKPRLKQVIDLYKDAGCLILMHCCGHVMEIIEDIIDLGVDILNPIQVKANNLSALREKTKDKVALYGGIDAHTVATGTPEQVFDITVTTLSSLDWRNGGYIAAPDIVLPFPQENVKAMEYAVRDFGVR